ncbi:hypothetical protein C6P45_004461 [Maudiozyma exigua]|uniref:Uncharacterized protein n=1 Tax=Maudiozyma exigua TaxID=34358 RepID=A0A9P6WFD4_MAUEX|nr:hypothetical protein C6P45_004461 [Kazachstania exigua]
MITPNFKSSLFRTGLLALVISIFDCFIRDPGYDPKTSDLSYHSFNLYRIPLAGMALFYSTNKSIGFNLTIIYSVLFESFNAIIVNFNTIPTVCATAENEIEMVRCFLGVANFFGSIFTSAFVLYVIRYYIKHPDFFKKDGSGRRNLENDEEGQTSQNDVEGFEPHEDITSYHILHPLQFSNGSILIVLGSIWVSLHLFRFIDLVSDVYSIRVMLFIYCLSRIVNETSFFVIFLVKLLGQDWEVSVHL